MRKPTTQKIAGLEAQVLASKDKGATIVLLHGYGASMHDLLQIAHYIDPQEKHAWYFPDAPLGLNFPGGYTGRAWFPLDVDALVRGVQQGRIDTLLEGTPGGFDQAVTMVRDFIRIVSPDEERLVLGGFSQGSMVAMHVALKFNLDLKALWLWSPSIIARSALMAGLAAKSANYPVVISHGQFDQVLPFQVAEALAGVLKNAGVDVRFIPFGGAHEIPPQVLHVCSSILGGI